VGCCGLKWFGGGVEGRESRRLLGDYRGRGKRPSRGRLAARCHGVSSATVRAGYRGGTDAPDASEVWGRQLIAGWRPAGGLARGHACSALVSKGLLSDDGIVCEGKGGHDRGYRDGRRRGGVRTVADGDPAFFRQGLHGGGGRGVAGRCVVGGGWGGAVLFLDSDGKR
jgi:hypothetical protein